MTRLTEAMADRAIRPASGQRFLRDAKVLGLALRISSGGAKAWVWEGRVRGRVRRITLGHHPALSLVQARKKALTTAAAVSEGKDPAAERARERGELTFGAFAQSYLERYHWKVQHVVSRAWVFAREPTTAMLLRRLEEEEARLGSVDSPPRGRWRPWLCCR